MGTSTGSGWKIGFDHYDPADEGRREALLAVGNGRIVTRAASVDAVSDGCHYPGTYLAGFYNRLDGRADNEPVEIEALVNLPNWLPIRWRVEAGSWFSVDRCELLDYRHELDLASGLACRAVTLRDEEGRRTRLVERRLVSMERPQLLAHTLELIPLAWSGAVEIRAALDGDVRNTNVGRFCRFPDRHLERPDCSTSEVGVLLSTRTRGFGTSLALAQRTTLLGDGVAAREVKAGEWSVAEQFLAEVEQGCPLRVEKVVALAASRDLASAEPDRAAARLVGRAPDFTVLEGEHREAWARLWAQVGFEIENPELERHLRFQAFHILQTLSPHTADLDAGIPARGWHGEAYHGHVFWDEVFVLPFLIPRFPSLARSFLLYRYRRLDEARAAARDEGWGGAMYPWRSASDGCEVTPHLQLNMISGRWMHDNTHLQRYIGSIIAYNVWQYYQCTGDRNFLVDHGAEMILEIARFWASRVEYDPKDDRYDIRGVVGPDEYHNAYPGAERPGLDNNAFTNITTAWTMRCALEMLDDLPERNRHTLIRKLDLRTDELRLWDRISRRMRVVFHGKGIISQFEGFDNLRRLDRGVLPEHLADKRIDWALEAVGETADAFQVTKQADVLTLFYLFPLDETFALLERLGYAFDRDALERTVDYYLARTTHRSSLSRIVYAGALAQVDPERSWTLFREALGTDLHALKGQDTAEGIHLGAMGGSFDVLQRRYLGLAFRSGGIRLNPALPPEIGAFRLMIEIGRCRVEVSSCNSRIRILPDPDNKETVTVEVAGRRQVLAPGQRFSVSAPEPGREARRMHSE